MSSYTLPPPDLSSPISKRAVQILRELQGLRLLDKQIPTLSQEVNQSAREQSKSSQRVEAADASQRIEPVLDRKNPVKPAAAPIKTSYAPVNPWRKVPFSRENYLKDVRSNLLGSMLFAILLLIIVFGVMTTATVSYLLPSMESLEQQSETIKRLPTDLKSATDQIQLQEKRRQELMTEQAKLVSYFPNSQQAYISYGGFLTLLEGHKVAVTSQKGGITQSVANPLLAEAASNIELRKKAEQALAANPKAPPPPAPKLSMLSGDIKPGLNYYHLAFTLEGSYVGYLAARQALVNENPNLVVHSESVVSLKDRPSVLEITTYVSIPFIQKP